MEKSAGESDLLRLLGNCVINICNACLERILLSRNLRIVPDKQWFAEREKFNQKINGGVLNGEDYGFLSLTLIGGCLAKVIQKQKEISKICTNYQNLF